MIEGKTQLEIRESTVEDRGDYRLAISNVAGSCNQLFQVTVFGIVC